MKSKNNFKFLVWAIAVLAIMNLATIGTIIFNRYRSPKKIGITVLPQKRFDKNSIKYSGRFFREKLNFNQEQMKWFSEYNPVFRQGAQNINIELAKARFQMLEEMSKSESDTVKLNQLSDSIGVLHSSLKKLTFRYYLELKQICNQDQRVRLQLLFRDMFAGDEHMRDGADRGPYGRQYGRKIRK